MMMYKNEHKFHIPVLGTGFSIDAPLKVSRYGISSVMSLVDDIMMEKLRKHYCDKNDLVYEPISSKEEDSRARRVTAYLNLVNKLAADQFAELKKSEFIPGSGITKYFEMLPESSGLKKKYSEMLNSPVGPDKNALQLWLRNKITPGSIDVNIMTKVDKTNYSRDGKPLPSEYNDAHASLRGYARSELQSSVIFSAGMNPRLYGYAATLKDFHPDTAGNFKKKIIIKVSDFRSALIQGKFLANKGLWVSEFRVESGLNCGGHAFATDGLLMGPILEEFKLRKAELVNSMRELFLKAQKNNHRETDHENLNVDITAQGGVGTFTEQQFLIRRYDVKSVGWGSLFLLVPEVMNVDDYTLEKLRDAGEKDIYLSDVSPLGVPFNNLRESSKEIEKLERIKRGKPGSPCPKKYLLSSKEFSSKPLCTASISYINKKKAELDKNPQINNGNKNEFDKALEKSCLCEGLAASALIVSKISEPKFSSAVSVCPGPNLAYYSKISGLKETVDHIYGRIDLVTNKSRPNLFIKEISLYIDFLEKKIEESEKPLTEKTQKYLEVFYNNLTDGIAYYRQLSSDMPEETESVKRKFSEDLHALEFRLLSMSPGKLSKTG